MEIEKAIQEFEDEAYHHSLHPGISDAAKAVALAALREMQEQERGCECCKGNGEIGHQFDIRKEYGWHELYGYDSFGSECSATIYFCPMCGRPLTEK